MSLEELEEPLSVTRSSRVAERLRQALLDGCYPVGTRLNEVRLCQELNVSRTPVRAALQTLAGEGLVLQVPHRGFTVRGFSVADIVDAFEMRALAEGLGARLAAEKGLSGPARLALETALAEGDVALADTSDCGTQRGTYAHINDVFHATIRMAANSNLVNDVVRLCHRVPQASARNVMAFDLDDVRERHRSHHMIFEAILAREGAEAERLMRQHVLWVKKSMVRAASKHSRFAE